MHWIGINMGLDNIPKVYPCQKENTAILDKDGRIDCDETISAGKCPHKREMESSVLLKQSNAKPTYGMFGVACWYRGKYGNMLLALLENGSMDTYQDTVYSFYGEGGDDGEKGLSVEYCYNMSQYMKNHTEEFSNRAYVNYPDEAEDLIKDWIYACWWLGFVAEYAEGSSTWY
jgi:hypothetical protein